MFSPNKNHISKIWRSLQSLLVIQSLQSLRIQLQISQQGFSDFSTGRYWETLGSTSILLFEVQVWNDKSFWHLLAFLKLNHWKHKILQFRPINSLFLVFSFDLLWFSICYRTCIIVNSFLYWLYVMDFW